MGNKCYKLLIGLTALILLSFFAKDSFAAGSATIYTSPASGNRNVGEKFSVDLVVDGGGTAFNAAKLNVSVSNNLVIKDITLGNCDFAFVTTPTVNNPSFVGAILGGSSLKCNVYTMILQVREVGNGYIVLSNGSIKAYSKATEIFSFAKNSVFVLNPSSTGVQSLVIDQTQAALLQTTPNSYGIVLTIKNQDGATLPGAVVDISYQNTDKSKNLQSVLSQSTNTNGVVQFANLRKGTYIVKAQYQGKLLAEKVINLNDQNRVVALGIQAKSTGINILWIIIIVATMIIVTAVSVVVYKKRNLLFKK